ncbi:MAG: hypothetical protein MUE69_14385 [Myxococcota bacterium]|nr:hypothetical protein [Myxococcota bacterium]
MHRLVGLVAVAVGPQVDPERLLDRDPEVEGARLSRAAHLDLELRGGEARLGHRQRRGEATAIVDLRGHLLHDRPALLSVVAQSHHDVSAAQRLQLREPDHLVGGAREPELFAVARREVPVQRELEAAAL